VTYRKHTTKKSIGDKNKEDHHQKTDIGDEMKADHYFRASLLVGLCMNL